MTHHGDKRGMDFVYDDGGRSRYGKPRQRKSQVGDCCVRSVAIVSDARYDLVWKRAKWFTDTPGTGMSESAWKSLASMFTGLDFRIPDKNYLRGKALRDCYEDLRHGRYLVSVHEQGRKRHVTAVVDGDVHDTWDCRDYEVNRVLTVFPKSNSIEYPEIEIGQDVVFERMGGERALGVVEAINPKSVTVTQVYRGGNAVTASNSVWRVARSLVQHVDHVCRDVLENAASQPRRLSHTPEVGEKVSFAHKGEIKPGEVVRINKQTVTISVPSGSQEPRIWRVPHERLLEPKE